MSSFKKKNFYHYCSEVRSGIFLTTIYLMMALREKESEPQTIISIPSQTPHPVNDGPSGSNPARLLHVTLRSLLLALMRIQLAFVPESFSENLNKAHFPSGLPQTVCNCQHSSLQAASWD